MKLNIFGSTINAKFVFEILKKNLIKLILLMKILIKLIKDLVEKNYFSFKTKVEISSNYALWTNKY